MPMVIESNYRRVFDRKARVVRALCGCKQRRSQSPTELARSQGIGGPGAANRQKKQKEADISHIIGLAVLDGAGKHESRHQMLLRAETLRRHDTVLKPVCLSP